MQYVRLLQQSASLGRPADRSSRNIEMQHRMIPRAADIARARCNPLHELHEGPTPNFCRELIGREHDILDLHFDVFQTHL